MSVEFRAIYITGCLRPQGGFGDWGIRMLYQSAPESGSFKVFANAESKLLWEESIFSKIELESRINHAPTVNGLISW